MKTGSQHKSFFTALLTGALCLITACGGGSGNSATNAGSTGKAAVAVSSAPAAASTNEAADTAAAEDSAAAAEERAAMEQEAAKAKEEEESGAQGAAGGVAETPDDAFAGIRVQDNVLFDEEGIKITFEGCRVENGNVNFIFQQENNHPDNKKMQFGPVSININRLHVESSGKGRISLRSSQSSDVYELESGEKVKTESWPGYETRNYPRLLALLGTEVKDFPIECISFDFFVQIGSDGKRDYRSVTLQTEAYNGDSYMQLYGEHCGTTHISGIDVYGRYDETGYTVVFLPTGERVESESIGAYKLAVNGKELEKKETTDMTIPSGMGTVYPSGGIVLHTSQTEDEIRKSLEIGNDEPLEFQLLNYNLPGGLMTLFTK
ncbi:MAG: hypothetical protein IJR00_08680 [Lachnospiraceae bacterium]|nr:hypothetical protein [Lachnospiraceae bacterium]